MRPGNCSAGSPALHPAASKAAMNTDTHLELTPAPRWRGPAAAAVKNSPLTVRAPRGSYCGTGLSMTTKFYTGMPADRIANRHIDSYFRYGASNLDQARLSCWNSS
jgi:hypothetical protein